MRRPFRGDMPVLLTLPLHFDLRLRGRERRWRRIAVAVLAVLGLALLAGSVLKPAKAEIEAPRMPSLRAQEAMPAATFAIGDVVVVESAKAAPAVYEVIALDVVDTTRAELALDFDDNDVVIVANAALGGDPVVGRWNYVVTARRAF